MPRVSVIIPAYNYARFLPESIESALTQTFHDLEIIVVDDGSTDDTLEVARGYEGKIRYHRQANRGISAARNAGCRMASGEFFAFLDADDIWDPEKISRQVEVFKASPKTSLVSTYLRFIDSEGKPLHGQKPSVVPGETLKDIIYRGSAAPSTFMVRRSCFESVSGFDESLMAMEDLDFCLRVARKHVIRHIPENLGAYRVHGPSLSGNPAKVYPSFIAIYKKLLNNSTGIRTRGIIRRRLARYRYLWGVYQMKSNRSIHGKQLVRSALATWPLVGWSLDASRPWWIRLGHLAKPYLVMFAPSRQAN